MCERAKEREREREAVTSFSVCIPGNCSAALLNNETSAYMYVCVGWWEDKSNYTRFRAGMKVQICRESFTEKGLTKLSKLT